MEHYAGMDVSLESVCVCVVDGSGRIVREAKLACEPAPLIGWFTALDFPVARIGLEAGPLSQWLYAAMAQAGLAVALLETRHVRDAFKAMPVKSDRTDARGIAQLMRLGWFRPVHCKSLPAQEVRARLTARKLVQAKRHDLEMSLRGILRGFGRKVGKTTPRMFEGRIRELVAGHATLTIIAEALLAARAALARELRGLEKRVRETARTDQRTRLLMSTPGVGAIVALTYVAAIDDPGRFRSSKQSDPIRWRPSADPGQKRDPGEWIRAQKGIDQRRPVTEGWHERRRIPPVSGRAAILGLPSSMWWVSLRSTHPTTTTTLCEPSLVRRDRTGRAGHGRRGRSRRRRQ